MKRNVLALVIIAIAVLFVGCGGGASGNGTNETSSDKVGTPAVSDIKYVAEPTIIDDERVVGIAFTNNSKHDLFSIEAVLKVKSDADLSCYTTLWEALKDEDETIEEINELVKTVDFEASVEQPLGKGETSDPASVTIGGMVGITTMDQYDCLELDRIKYTYRNKDDLYEVTYDAVNDKMGNPEYLEPAVAWPKSDFGKKMPLIEDAMFVTDLTEHGDAENLDRYAGVDIQPITKSDYEEYIKKAVEAGFSGDTDPNGWTVLEDKDGNKLSIYFFEDEQRMSIHLEEKNYE